MSELSIESQAFAHDGLIPRKYTCDGGNVNPPLIIDDIPERTKSLALIMDDPDYPKGTWVHWVLWNIDPVAGELPENTVPGGAFQGMNDFSKQSYEGPCPPSGTHRYYFKLYALDALLALKAGATKAQLEQAMSGHILGKAELVGLYRRG